MEYLTKDKKKELEEELNKLKSVRRKEIADALLYAKSLGDLSEIVKREFLILKIF